MAKKRHRKSPNGQGKGNTYLLKFDDTPEGQRARQMAQRLASKRQLKAVIYDFLLMLDDVEARSQVEPNPHEIISRFGSILLNGAAVQPPLHPPPAEFQFDLATDFDATQPVPALPDTDRMAESMGDLFGGGDDDDLWDD